VAFAATRYAGVDSGGVSTTLIPHTTVVRWIAGGVPISVYQRTGAGPRGRLTLSAEPSLPLFDNAVGGAIIGSGNPTSSHR
jgi:hypothetical protein